MTAPEVPHADLIARLRNHARSYATVGLSESLREAADALAALGDTVTRAEYRQANTDWRNGMLHVEAERDALAHVIEQAKVVIDQVDVYQYEVSSLRVGHVKRALDTAPAVSLALHDAEVKAQALDEAAEAFAAGGWSHAFLASGVQDDVSAVQATDTWFKARAATFRAEAK